MSSHVILFGWNRSIPGREPLSRAHFGDFVQYLTGLEQKKAIDGFDVVFLDPHGGDLNGFFLIKGSAAQLHTLASSSDWITHMTRAALHLEAAGAIHGATGDEISKRMEIWSKLIPGA